jgi:hypothetical protein
MLRHGLIAKTGHFVRILNIGAAVMVGAAADRGAESGFAGGGS